MGKRGSLTTSEKLASRNPAARREGQREAAQMSSSKRAATVSKAKSIASRGYSSTVSPSQVPSSTQIVATQKSVDTSQVVSGGLSTAEKIASVNPATRAEGQAELTSAKQAQQQQQQMYQYRADVSYRVAGAKRPEPVPEQISLRRPVDDPTAEWEPTKTVRYETIEGVRYKIETKPGATITHTQTKVGGAFSKYFPEETAKDSGTYGTYKIFGKDVTFKKPKYPEGPLETMESVGRTIVAGSEKVSQYIEIKPSPYGRAMILPVSKEEREIQKRGSFESIMRGEGLAEQQRGGWKSEWLPAGDVVFGDTKEFQTNVRTAFKEAKYTEKETDLAVKAATRQRYWREGGEVAATALAETVGEIVGGGLIGRSVRGLGLYKGTKGAVTWTLAKKIAPGYAVAGAAEGMIQYGATQQQTGQKSTIYSRTAVATASGAVAATIGTGITLASVSTSKVAMKLGKLGGLGVSIADPLEKVGDIAGAAITKGQLVKVTVPGGLGTIFGTTKERTTTRRRSYRTTRTVDISKSPAVKTPTGLITLTPTTAVTTKTPITTWTATPTLVPTWTTTPTRAMTRTGTSVITRTPTFISTPTTTPTFTFTETPTATPTRTTAMGLWDAGADPFKWRRRRRAPTAGGIYKPSLAGLASGQTIAKAPKFTTGIFIRKPVRKRKSTTKKRKRGKKK